MSATGPSSNDERYRAPLTRLRLEGKSYSQMAEELSTSTRPLNRNAVAAIIHRLAKGEAMPPSTHKTAPRSGPKVPRVGKPRVARPAPPPPQPRRPLPLLPPRPMPGCAWHGCTEPVVARGKPFCREHRR